MGSGNGGGGSTAVVENARTARRRDPRTSFHDGNAIFSSTSSRVRENAQTFTDTNRTAHVGSNLLHSQQGCFPILKRGISDLSGGWQRERERNT